MNPETINQITKYLDKIGAKLGQSAETVWPWLIKQIYINAMTSFIVLIIAVILFYISTILMKKNGEYEMAVIISGIMVITMIFVLLIFGIRIFNPGYWAFQDLMRMVQ